MDRIYSNLLGCSLIRQSLDANKKLQVLKFYNIKKKYKLYGVLLKWRAEADKHKSEVIVSLFITLIS